MRSPPISDLQHDPIVEKLVDFAKKKKSVSFEEVTGFLPDWIVNSDRIDEIAAILEKNGVKLQDEDTSKDDDRPVVRSNRKLLQGEKETAVDDPIRLYLREIGRERLLTAEQEVTLSKRMEDGENIIKKVFTSSGALIPEFYRISLRARSAKDPREMNLSKKQASEFLADRRRLNAWYKETIKQIYSKIKTYIEEKEKLSGENGAVLSNERLDKLRPAILKCLSNISYHQDEINSISDMFSEAARKITTINSEQEIIEQKLRVANPKELRNLGRGLAQKAKQAGIEEDLGITADKIKDLIRVLFSQFLQFSYDLFLSYFFFLIFK